MRPPRRARIRCGAGRWLWCWRGIGGGSSVAAAKWGATSAGGERTVERLKFRSKRCARCSSECRMTMRRSGWCPRTSRAVSRLARSSDEARIRARAVSRREDSWVSIKRKSPVRSRAPREMAATRRSSRVSGLVMTTTGRDCSRSSSTIRRPNRPSPQTTICSERSSWSKLRRTRALFPTLECFAKLHAGYSVLPVVFCLPRRSPPPSLGLRPLPRREGVLSSRSDIVSEARRQQAKPETPTLLWAAVL